MTWRIPLTKGHLTTLISAYALTLNNIREDLYRVLDSVIQKILTTDKLILMRDFNARVDTNYLV